MKRIAISMLLVMCALSFAQDKKSPSKMLHVDFKNSEDGTSAQVTLPLSLLATVQPQIEQALADVKEETNIDFADIWNSVKDAGPTMLVDIDTPESKVKVSTTESHLKIYVGQRGDFSEMNVTVPLALGNALFGNENGLDYDAIIKALLEVNEDLVVIDSATIKGRVWIE